MKENRYIKFILSWIHVQYVLLRDFLPTLVQYLIWCIVTTLLLLMIVIVTFGLKLEVNITEKNQIDYHTLTIGVRQSKEVEGTMTVTVSDSIPTLVIPSED